ncbi:MAG: NUDIX hydrolase [Turicibacter sp.]|nr:NUDIX hydrolase [Turicibacter sp.]
MAGITSCQGRESTDNAVNDGRLPLNQTENKSSKEFARMILKTPEGEFLLVKNANFRSWTVPGGKLEPGEDPKAAAIRETYEEIGVEVLEATHLYTGEFHFVDNPWLGHFYLGTTAKGMPEIREPDKIQQIQTRRTLNPLDFGQALHPLIDYLSTCPQLVDSETLWVN